MTKVIGNGLNGKRLWLRTPDHRWIEVPYGAGQDAKVRSVNVYDGQQWLSPAFGQTVRDTDGVDISVPFVNAVSVRTPGVHWVGSWNPTFYSTFGFPPVEASFASIYPDWLRLFHTRPRVDPTWRIVPLVYKIPTHVPNRKVSVDDKLNFWPNVNMRRHRNNAGVITDIVTTSSSSWTFISGGSALSWEWTSSVGWSGAAWSDTSSSAFLIDLAAIRKRLEQDYEYQGFDYTGQYHSIKQQLLRRVIVRARVTFWVDLRRAYGPPGNQPAYSGTELDGVIGSVRMRANVPVTHELHSTPPDFDWGRSADLQIPIDTTTTSSTPALSTFDTTDMLVTLTSRLQDSSGQGSPGFTEVYAKLPDASLNDSVVEWIIEAPGENNITFYADITGLPVPSTDFNDTEGCVAVMRVQPFSIMLHYSDTGTDTPSETHNPDSLG